MVTLGLITLLVACASTYGEASGDDASAKDDGGGDAAPSRDGGPSDAPPSDAPVTDAPTETESCPPCGSTATCVAAGCTGAGTPNSCSQPFDITQPIKLIVFACPEGSTIHYLDQCVVDGGTNRPHAAVFRMGTSTGSGGQWVVTIDKVPGSNSFIADGSGCQAVAGCSGGSSGPAAEGRVVAATTTVMIGTTNTLTTCQQIAVNFAPKP